MFTAMSPSSRGRGLKATHTKILPLKTVSPSSRGRGLKDNVWLYCQCIKSVALFTRAWIESDLERRCKVLVGGRPLHEGVD